MSWITLRNLQGHYLTADQDGRISADGTDRTSLGLFEMVNLAGGAVALRSLTAEHYLCVRDGQLAAVGEAAGSGERFTVQEDGEGRQTLSGPGAITFQLERLDEVADVLTAQTCCCGLEHPHPHSQPYADEVAAAAQAEAPISPVDLGPLGWNDKTHHWLVESAAGILLYHKETLPEARAFAAFWNHPIFRAAVFHGLYDADYVSPYKDTIYSCHFYDPDTRTNIFGHTDWTAYTQCVQYFTQSRQRALRIQSGQDTSDEAYNEAGYALGLSLHYLTDLTQPMHAANFANVLPTLNPLDRRHSGFEEYFESVIEQKDNPASPDYAKAQALQVDPASMSPAELSAWEFPTIGDLVDTVARHSKQVFLNHVQGPAEAKVHGVEITNTWTAAEADPAIFATVPYGQKMAARYLVEWVRRSINVMPYLPAGTRHGDRGRWDFSSTGDDGSWWNGNKRGGSPVCSLLTDNAFCLEGEYNFLWGLTGYTGYLRVALTQMRPDGTCIASFQDTGSVTGLMHFEAPVRFSMNEHSRELTCTGDGFSLWMKPFPADARWYAGVQLRIQVGDKSCHLCWENMHQ